MSSRNNRSRTSQHHDETLEADSGNHSTNEPSQKLSFATPTEFVTLPSRGKYYPPNHPLHNVESIEMRHMTAKEEDILVSQSLIEKGVVIDRLLKSLIVDDSVNLNTMLSGDKSALTVAARITGYGAEYLTKIVCPECSTEQDYEFDLNAGFEAGAIGSTEEINEELDGVELTENGTFLVDLPKSGFTAEIRFLTAEDEKNLEKFEKRNKSRGQEKTTFLTDTLKAMIVSVDGVTSKEEIKNFVNNMPSLDSKYLRGVYKNLLPTIDLTQEFSCKKCDFRQALEVPVNIEFFWPR